MAGGAMLIAVGAPTAVHAQAARSFDIPAQPLGSALQAFARQSGLQVAVDDGQIAGLRATAVRGSMTPDAALRRMLTGLDVHHEIVGGGTVVVRRAAAGEPVRRRAEATPAALLEPQQVEPRGAMVEDVVVTARRMEERIIDVPIAVSAFSEERLADLKIDGGSELLRAIPNVNFSKDNFTGYNFSIRGIGTKAISVTTDPAVAISFNNTTLLRNRLFEQEYFDVQRLEVLRGPQGTLYGRNATAGVVNMLPKLPELGVFSTEVQGEIGNYDARRGRGYINIPLGDQFAIRAAGAFTKRDGYDFNTVTEQNVNGRDLWSGRLGALWQPNDRFRVNLLWEHFEEDDDRSRTGKQLCTRGVPPTQLGWTDPGGGSRTSPVIRRWTMDSLTPGCVASSLYSDEAFGSPNGRGFPIVTGLILSTPFRDSVNQGDDVFGWGNYLFRLGIDPFSPASGRQSSDLREIETFYDPVFRAKNDVLQLNIEAELTDGLTLFSQTLYMEDSYYGSQDYFRINPVSGLIACREGRTVSPEWSDNLGSCTGVGGPNGGGTFIDPQLGALDRLVAVDLSQSKSRQWSQEFRLQSDFDGRFNFNLGVNWLKFETEEDYYVFSNAFTIAAIGQNQTAGYDAQCNPGPFANPDPNSCVHIDPNPIGQLDGEGHNYYRSLNISKTESWAIFGEGYFQLTDTLRLTAGLRYTDDEKTVTPVPTQLLSSTAPFGGGVVGRGYPRYPDEVQQWGEFTGRLALDLRPDLDFTDDTLLYASYSRGYKGGGGNPRGPDSGTAANYPPLPTSFAPEFVNAFEIGTKNILLGGELMLNGTAFYYDYKDYQVTQVIDRTLHNENFDATVYGAEFELAWAPTRNLRVDATLGLLKTRIADGESSIDVMDRLQGHDDWAVLRPWPTSPATCIVPKQVLGRFIEIFDDTGSPNSPNTGLFFIKALCPGPGNLFTPGPDNFAFDQWGQLVYNPITDAPNNGRGFSADLSGNSLPNAPELTFNIGAQYRIELPAGWDLTLRGDYYRQSDSFMRVYNTEYDRLKSWDNANLSATLSRPGDDVTVQVYVKNVFDDTPITDGFTGPDEIGNTTNVFTLDPRLIGVSIRKGF